MIAIGLTFIGLAAIIHIGFFYMESLAWPTPRVRHIFGTRKENVQVTKLLALNQGFYNLFLAVIALLGIVLCALGHQTVGATLAFAGAGMMVGAAVVLFCSKPGRGTLIAALVQGLAPALGATALAIGLHT